MSPINVPCPVCKTQLKLPNTSLVGKKARCPKCDNRFVITVPTTLEVAPADDLPVLPLAPQSGRGARWVPDQLPAAGGPAPHHAAAFSLGSEPVAPAAAQPTPGFAFPDLTAAASPASPASPGAPTPDAPPSSVLQRTRGRRRQASPARRWATAAATAAAILLVSISGFWIYRSTGSQPAQQQKIQVNKGYQQEKAQQVASNESATELSPTKGKPIPLDYIPFTPHVLVHLRPAELWKKDAVMGEFMAMLGDFGVWLGQQIETRTRHTPQEIAELTVAINFSGKATPPDVAMVVRLDEEQPHQDLVKQFGRMRPDPSVEVFEAADYSYLVVDARTFVVAPLLMAEDLVEARRSEAIASQDMEPLLQQSDRTRHLTLIFDHEIVDTHRDEAFSPELQTAANNVLFWFNEQVESVSLSMHLDPHCYIETLLRQPSSSTPVKLQRSMQVKLDRLAEDIFDMVRQMDPTNVASRQIIGRFPAMIQALNIGTTAHAGPGFARLVTLLPRHAAANLAVGSLLTWNQSLVTKFEDKSKLTKKTESTAIPDKVADRLKMKVIVDFRRTPLQEAFGYIGETIKTDVSIDGDALKGAGFTQNMPQTFDLGEISALEAIDAILEKYAKERDPLVLIVDEKNKKLILSTKVKAEADGLKPYNTKAK
jgi:hypothetical protein